MIITDLTDIGGGVRDSRRRMMMETRNRQARRYAILRSENPEAMDAAYAARVCANSDYMTFAEAAAITSGQLQNGIFRNKGLLHFEEGVFLKSFTSHVAGGGAFANNSGLSVLAFPPTFSAWTSGGLMYGSGHPVVLMFPRTVPNVSYNLTNTSNGMNQASAIYVYDDLVDTYKEAWSALSSKIFGFSSYTGKIIYPEHYNFG